MHSATLQHHDRIDTTPAYAELVSATNFSFLRGASHPFEMVGQAAGLGLAGLGVCDRNSLAGVVRAYATARDIKAENPDFKLVVGTRLVFQDGTPDIVVYPTDRDAYGRLCALLTRGNRAAPKGECHLALADLLEFLEGQRPGTASGVIFASLEDESGLANIIVWPKVFEANRKVVLGARVLGVRGQLQREGLVVHLIAKELIDLTPDLLRIANGHDIGEAMIAHADEGKSGPHGSRGRERDQYRDLVAKRVQEAALPSGRNFH